MRGLDDGPDGPNEVPRTRAKSTRPESLVATCTGCGEPAHASETDDEGYHAACRPAPAHTDLQLIPVIVDTAHISYAITSAEGGFDWIARARSGGRVLARGWVATTDAKQAELVAKAAGSTAWSQQLLSGAAA